MEFHPEAKRWSEGRWLDWYIDDQIKKGWSLFIGVVGRMQSGKSTLSLREAIKLDKGFSWDRVVLDDTGFVKQALKTPPPGSHFIVDDAGLQYDEWWTDRSKMLRHISQSLGMYRWVVWFTVPDEFDIIKKIRNKFNIYMRLSSNYKGVVSDVRIPTKDANYTIPKMLYPYPRVNIDGHDVKIRGMRFDPLPEKIFDYYQERIKKPAVVNDWQSLLNKIESKKEGGRDVNPNSFNAPNTKGKFAGKWYSLEDAIDYFQMDEVTLLSNEKFSKWKNPKGRIFVRDDRTKSNAD